MIAANLAVRSEKNLFIITVLLASLFWLALIGLTLGLITIYLLFAFLSFLFAHSLMISYIKGNAVKIMPGQFPDLYEKISAACEKIGMPIPDSYLMNSEGAVNAFVTRFLNRNYLVLYSSVIDSLDERPSSIDFYIGHELGHIHRGHLIWKPFFLPLSVLPLLLRAYHRACETTCDQYGLFCCESSEDAVRALSVIAAGSKRWRTISPEAYALQIEESGGFWMTFNELFSSYPWLCKRIAMVQDKTAPERFPRRSASAQMLALFCPGFAPVLPLMVIFFLFLGITRFPSLAPRKDDFLSELENLESATELADEELDNQSDDSF